MAVMNITVHNTGCGLGDMLNRIDVIYRYCSRRGFNFVFPDIASALHEQDYAERLGLTRIKPRKAEWAGQVRTLPFQALFEEHPLQGQEDGSTLFAVQFDHTESARLARDFDLRTATRFDFRPYVQQSVFPPPKQGEFDYIIHLRLGDNYAYQLPDGRIFDTGNRRIVNDTSRLKKTLDMQWTIKDVVAAINWLNGQHKTYAIHCDGIESAIRHIRWTKQSDYMESRQMLFDTVNGFLDALQRQTRDAMNLHIGNEDIVSPIRDMMSAGHLIYTTGGFMRSINKFFNSPPTNSTHLKEFLKGTVFTYLR